MNPPLADSAQPRLSAFPVAMLVCAAGVALAIVGALGPWARVPTYGATYGNATGPEGIFWVRGLEAPGMVPLVGDGAVVLVMVALSAGLILWRLIWPPKSSGFVLLCILTLLLLAAVIGTVNWLFPGNIPQADSRTYFKASVEVSWGLGGHVPGPVACRSGRRLSAVAG